MDRLNNLAVLVVNVLILALIAMAYAGLSSRLARLEQQWQSGAAAAPPPMAATAGAGTQSPGLPYPTAGERLSLRLSNTLGHRPAATRIASGSRSPAASRRASAAPLSAPPERQSWFGRMRGAIGAGPDDDEIMFGMRDALRIGTDDAVARLSLPGGYNDDEHALIALPKKLEAVRNVLKSVGMATLMDSLQTQMNEAAELSANYAGQVFHKAIDEMPPADPERLLGGSDTAATDHLRSRMATRIVGELKPIIEARLAEVGALDTYEQAMGVYSALPFVPTIDGDLTHYVTTKAMEGVFYYVAETEQAIRKDPQRRSTPALQAVFGEG